MLERDVDAPKNNGVFVKKEGHAEVKQKSLDQARSFPMVPLIDDTLIGPPPPLIIIDADVAVRNEARAGIYRLSPEEN